MSRPRHESDTEHFTTALWADFVRDLATDKKRREMQTHLDAGCEQCQATVDRLRAVARMAANERMIRVPDDVVNRAKQIARTPPVPPS